MVNNIVNIINNELVGLHAAQKVYGLAQSVIRYEGDAAIYMPAVIGVDGEAMYVGVDDVESIITYHKLNNATIRNLGNGRGDKTGDVRNLYSLSIILFWIRSKLNVYPDELLTVVQARMPGIITGLQDIKHVYIIVLNTNFNTFEVYNSEYNGDPNYRLPENMHLMQINYQVDVTFNPDCFKKCINC